MGNKHKTVYIELCTFYIVLCAVYIVLCIVFSVHWTVNIKKCSVYFVQYTLNSVEWLLCGRPSVASQATAATELGEQTLHCTPYTVHCILHTLHCTLYTVRFTLHTLHCTLYTVRFTLHALQYTLYTANCRRYTANFTVNTQYFTNKPKENSMLIAWHLLGSDLTNYPTSDSKIKVSRYSALLYIVRWELKSVVFIAE